MVLAAIVAIVTSAVVANATQTITTPNAAFISYNLNPGADTSPITPATNRSVLVMGCCTSSTSGVVGVGQVNLLHTPIVGMTWVAHGMDGFSEGIGISTMEAHITYIDNFHQVDIRVESADTILVHNGASTARAGNVTLIW